MYIKKLITDIGVLPPKFFHNKNALLVYMEEAITYERSKTKRMKPTLSAKDTVKLIANIYGLNADNEVISIKNQAEIFKSSVTTLYRIKNDAMRNIRHYTIWGNQTKQHNFIHTLPIEEDSYMLLLLATHPMLNISNDAASDAAIMTAVNDIVKNGNVPSNCDAILSLLIGVYGDSYTEPLVTAYCRKREEVLKEYTKTELSWLSYKDHLLVRALAQELPYGTVELVSCLIGLHYLQYLFSGVNSDERFNRLVDNVCQSTSNNLRNDLVWKSCKNTERLLLAYSNYKELFNLSQNELIEVLKNIRAIPSNITIGM